MIINENDDDTAITEKSTMDMSGSLGGERIINELREQNRQLIAANGQVNEENARQKSAKSQAA